MLRVPHRYLALGGNVVCSIYHRARMMEGRVFCLHHSWRFVDSAALALPGLSWGSEPGVNAGCKYPTEKPVVDLKPSND